MDMTHFTSVTVSLAGALTLTITFRNMNIYSVVHGLPSPNISRKFTDNLLFRYPAIGQTKRVKTYIAKLWWR